MISWKIKYIWWIDVCWSRVAYDWGLATLMDSWPHALYYDAKTQLEGGRERALEDGKNKLRKWRLDMNFYLTKMFSEPQLNKDPYAPTHPGLPHLRDSTVYMCKVSLPLHPPTSWALISTSLLYKTNSLLASTIMLTCSANFWSKEQLPKMDVLRTGYVNFGSH